MKKFHLTLVFTALFLFVIGLSVSWTDSHTTTQSENKELLRNFYEEVFNQHNVDAAAKFIAKDAVSHRGLPGMPKGLERAKQRLSMYFAAFPDIKITVEDMVAEGDKVVARYTMSGTHKGGLMGIAATGKKVSITGIEIIRVSAGKLVEHWGASDGLGMMRQVGAIPSPAPAVETVTLAVTGMT